MRTVASYEHYRETTEFGVGIVGLQEDGRQEVALFEARRLVLQEAALFFVTIAGGGGEDQETPGALFDVRPLLFGKLSSSNL